MDDLISWFLNNVKRIRLILLSREERLIKKKKAKVSRMHMQETFRNTAGLNLTILVKIKNLGLH